MRKTVLVIGIPLIFLGFAVNLVIHEISHYAMVLLFGGQVHNISLGVESFVSGTVAEEFVPWVAMASVYIPMLISFAFLFAKNRYVAFFASGFSMPIVVNLLMGLFAFLTETNISIRETYDVVKAADCLSSPLGLIFVCCILFCIALVFTFRLAHIAVRD